jgi:hypothetical protein
MYNRGLKIFLTLILCLISSGYFLAFADGGKSVHDVLSGKGFNEKGSYFCSIKNGSTIKNTNQDVPILLDRLKKVAVTEGVPEPSDYTIWLASGSSFLSQVIFISVAKTGNGYVEYMNRKIAFFKSVDLYEFCVAAFNKSKILVHS